MSITMKAVVVKDGKGPIENLYIGETPMPKAAQSGQVVVKVVLDGRSYHRTLTLPLCSGQNVWPEQNGFDVSGMLFVLLILPNRLRRPP